MTNKQIGILGALTAMSIQVGAGLYIQSTPWIVGNLIVGTLVALAMALEK